MVHPVDQLRRRQRVCRVGIGEHHEIAHYRRNKKERARGEDVRPRFAVRAREGLSVELTDPVADIAASPVYDAVAARHQPVQVAMHRLAWPVALRSSKVRRCPSVKRGHRQDLGRREAVEVATSCQRQQVLQPVPVLASRGDKVLRPHYKTKIS